MRMLTGFVAAIASLLDWLFGIVRAAFTDPDPVADLEAEEAQVRAEIADLDSVDAGPVATARRFLAGDNRGYSGLPLRAQAWLVMAAERGVVVEDASDRDVAGWLAGTAEHPRVPVTAVMAVVRGEHPPAEVALADEASWSLGLSPAF